MDIKNTISSYVVGNESLLISACDILLKNNVKINGIVTEEGKIKKYAEQNGIPTAEFSDIQNFITGTFDYLFSITNLRILPENILTKAKIASINFHDGILPDYAGLNVTSYSILNGEKEHGVTWHLINKDIDKGEILIQEKFDIDEKETAFSLNAKCFEKGIETFDKIIPNIVNKNIISLKQDFSKRKYFSKYQKPSVGCLIDWTHSAEQISRLIRCMDFSNYDNPIGTPKFLIHNDFYIVDSFEILKTPSESFPGTIIKIEVDSLIVSTGTNDIKISGIKSAEGTSVLISYIIEKYQIVPGFKLNNISQEHSKLLQEFEKTINKKEDYWITKLANIKDLELINTVNTQKTHEYITKYLNIPEAAFSSLTKVYSDFNLNDLIEAMFVEFISLFNQQNEFSIGYTNGIMLKELNSLSGLFSAQVPLNIIINDSNTIGKLLYDISLDIKTTKENKTFYNDIYFRRKKSVASSKNYSVCILSIDDIKSYDEPESTLTFVSTIDNRYYLQYNSSLLSEENIKILQKSFIHFIEEFISNYLKPFNKVDIIYEEEKKLLLEEWNNTRKEYNKQFTINKLFEEQVLKNHNKIAVKYLFNELTFSELNIKANILANHLIQLNIQKEDLIGIYLNRSENLLVAILAVLKAGGAYVPLDPSFPKERIQYMAEDAKMKIIITDEDLREQLLDVKHERLLDVNIRYNLNINNPQIDLESTNLAYVIYTSGSTGKPKGVMVQHNNVINFFDAMKDKININDKDSWLAVTSLSFDISVLELLWTITSGMKVVIYNEDDWLNYNIEQRDQDEKEINFSLFYFSSDVNEKEDDKYKLLFEGAKFADINGFEAIWTPERHFHEFGGLYPNPSVTSAALAAITKNIGIRAGSVVSPLHSSIRIAEEWSVVDNISKGRVGISFAAGWMPDDFSIMPKNFVDRKNIMFQQMEEVKKLWDGESVEFTNASGQQVNIKTLPLPYNKNIPLWVTAAGNPETFQMAGEKGYNLLTHLLGQSLDELEEKVVIYRRALEENGHENGKITLMLHTFIGKNDQEVKELVREPMKEYLKSSVDLIKKAAWSFPAFKETTTTESGKFTLDNLSPEELDAILDYSFERYYETSGLFGSLASGLKIVNHLKKIGVDEIACLIDFGVSTDIVLENLKYLNEVKELSRKKSVEFDFSIPGIIYNNSITHMQCTPSMAKMLVAENDSLEELKKLKYLLIGGEAFPPQLAEKLYMETPSTIFNMYGPTETTIWSTMQKIDKPYKQIPIGRPINNTSIYILNKNLQLSPIGTPGEIFIGGDGVVRGYFNNPNLTNERFIQNPFNKEERIYRTGDLGRYKLDGTIEYLGRTDFQVKVRGYRIELGEIEAQLCKYAGIQDAAVIVNYDLDNNPRIIAYITIESKINIDEVKKYLRKFLPEYMIPSGIMILDQFPKTPNGKLDRKAFPAFNEEIIQEEITTETISFNDLETDIANIWRNILNIKNVNINDNFFDIGGHSLLAVQVHHKLVDKFGIKISLIDIFRFPTVKSLSAHIESLINNNKNLNNYVEDNETIERKKINRVRNKQKEIGSEEHDDE